MPLEDATEPASVELVASSLTDLEQTLRALDRATLHAAEALIPPAGVGESVAGRYARAAASWPGPVDHAPPSHERQAQLLSALHDTAATLRAGAECCRRARDILTSTIA